MIGIVQKIKIYKMHTKFKTHPKFYHTAGAFAPVIDNLIHEVFNTPVNEVVNEKGLKKTTPAANIIEFENKYEIKLAVPGFKKEKISISIEKNNLVISGDNESEEVKYKHREFNNIGFKRSFNLSDLIDKSSVTASYNNGILTVSLQKVEQAKPKNIEII